MTVFGWWKEALVGTSLLMVMCIGEKRQPLSSKGMAIEGLLSKDCYVMLVGTYLLQHYTIKEGHFEAMEGGF